MGRNNKAKKTTKTAKVASVKEKQIKENELSKSAQQTAAKFKIDQILQKVEECMDTFNYELAQKFCQRALEVEPDNVKVLETSGALLLELGNPDGAKQCFGRAVEISPDIGHSKYMYLGQLFEGKQSAECFQKGIEVMQSVLDSQEQAAAAAPVDGDDKVTKRDLSSAYCSLAELYTTDLCFDDDAETMCKSNIEKAIEVDPDNPESYQMMANFHLVKDDKDEAKNMIQKSVSLWLPKLQSHDTDSTEFDPIEVCSLPYQARIQTAQILTEVEDFETSAEILDRLIEEDDEVIQVWYMLGLVNNLQGEDYKGNARFFLNKAKELSSKIPCDDEPMLKHIDELLAELGPGDANETEEDMANDEHVIENPEEYSSESEDEAMEQ